jgi:formylmethanofuran dehydrogenase subunit E
MNKKVTLRQAVRFHGHLGPWLVLGVLMGEYAVKALKGKKYFGMEVKVWGANKRPRSCLVDGLQLSTGATYGKGNITKYNGSKVKVDFFDLARRRSISCGLTDRVQEILNTTKDHAANEKLARELYRSDPRGIFRITAKED